MNFKICDKKLKKSIKAVNTLIESGLITEHSANIVLANICKSTGDLIRVSIQDFND